MDIEKLLEVVLDKILEVTGFERGFILLLDERGRPTERMRRARTQDAPKFDRAESDFSGSIVKRVAQTGEAVAVTDVADDAALRNQRSVIALGLRSVMCAPMRQKGRVTGIIYIDSRLLAEVGGESDLTLLEALASQASIAIENARLVSEEQRRSELIAILAHEIRNPLAGILGFSDLMPEERTELPARAVELIERVHQDAERLRRLVENILEMARVDAGKIEWMLSPVSMDRLIHDAQAAYAVMAGRQGVSLIVDVASGLPAALGDADRLYQVLSNLVGNALKFTPKGGRIVLSARAETLSEIGEGGRAGDRSFDDLAAWLPLTPGVGEPRAFIRVDVTDSGPGIPPERREQLFGKFAQGKESGRARGVGLGLYISRDIVRRHGGMIWVESEVGKGASFSFRIPAAQEA